MSFAGAAVSLAAAVVSAFFTAYVLRRFLATRKPHNGMWALGLTSFTLVAVVQLIAETGGWTDGLFRAWYVLGTSLVGFLGAGSVYIAHRRIGHAFTAYVGILFLAFVAVAATTPTNPLGLATFTAGSPPDGEGWVAGALVRRFSPLFTIPGSLALIGIAAYGLYRYRLTYNAWIAAGAAVLAVGTGLARFGNASLIYGSEFAGIALMYFGFRRATEWAKARGKDAPLVPAKDAQDVRSAPATLEAAKK